MISRPRRAARLRPARFDDLGLRRAISDRLLPLLVAAMAFLASLALAGAVAASALARQWQEGAGSTLTVQVPQPRDRAAEGRGSREERVLALLREAPGISVLDKREPGGYATPVEAVGEYDTFVSRIREDNTVENGLAIWVVSDNLRKGAALNTIQIAEELIARGLQSRKAAA